MRLDPWVMATIAAMAAVTYLNRAGGYWLFRTFNPPQIVRDVLAYVPGGLFVSYVMPKLVAGGPQEWVGAAVTAAVMAWSGNLALAILGGAGAAWVVWAGFTLS